jgi:hypothetical protein
VERVMVIALEYPELATPYSGLHITFWMRTDDLAPAYTLTIVNDDTDALLHISWSAFNDFIHSMSRNGA